MVYWEVEKVRTEEHVQTNTTRRHGMPHVAMPCHAAKRGDILGKIDSRSIGASKSVELDPMRMQCNYSLFLDTCTGAFSRSCTMVWGRNYPSSLGTGA